MLGINPRLSPRYTVGESAVRLGYVLKMSAGIKREETRTPEFNVITFSTSLGLALAKDVWTIGRFVYLLQIEI